MSRGGARKQATLKFDRDVYYLDALKSGSLTIEQMQSEYRRLSIIAQRRLERFEQSKEWSSADIYREYAGRFQRPASSLTTKELRMELSDLAKFTSSKLSSIRGQQQYRNQMIKTLHERGYTGITKANFKDFTDFMDEVQTLFRNTKFPDSEQIYEVYKEARKRGVKSGELLHDLDEWLENRDKISKLTIKETAGLSSKQIIELIKGR